ncbi:MAG: hypothetical protein E6R04_01300 [Spirochaetes bacterium]|nr:MAG: hypothetical protein E6R04_01300 [Spirochaetota bacterium]
MNRAFGIEIELKGATITSLRNKLFEAGFGNWSVVFDGSVDRGAEVVSPKLSGVEGLAEMEKVVTILREMGCFVDHQCGLHVHVDGAGLNPHTMANIVKRYAAFEGEIDSWITPERRKSENSYLNSVKGLEIAPQYTTQATANQAGSRYYKVNIQAFLRHGTIEFRQHHGTLSVEEISSWVQFCIQFVNNSVCVVSVHTIPGNGTLRSNAIEHKFAAMSRLLLRGGTVRVEEFAQALDCTPEAVPVYMSRFRTWLNIYDAIDTRRGVGYRLTSYSGARAVLEQRLQHPGLERSETVVAFSEPGLFYGLSESVCGHLSDRAEAYKILESFKFDTAQAA